VLRGITQQSSHDFGGSPPQTRADNPRYASVQSRAEALLWRYKRPKFSSVNDTIVHYTIA